MEISAINFVESADDTFELSFMYLGHNLVTQTMPRSVAKTEIRDEIKRVVNEWISKRADDNFIALKTEFEGKTITIK
jgi:hypothetical protein